MANSVDLDEVAHHKPPHQDLCCLQIQLFLSRVLKELKKSNIMQQIRFIFEFPITKSFSDDISLLGGKPSSELPLHVTGLVCLVMGLPSSKLLSASYIIYNCSVIDH